jgi:hypothetical protein
MINHWFAVLSRITTVSASMKGCGCRPSRRGHTQRAGVRKSLKKESAGSRARRCRNLYGDLAFAGGGEALRSGAAGDGRDRRRARNGPSNRAEGSRPAYCGAYYGRSGAGTDKSTGGWTGQRREHGTCG